MAIELCQCQECLTDQVYLGPDGEWHPTPAPLLNGHHHPDCLMAIDMIMNRPQRQDVRYFSNGWGISIITWDDTLWEVALLKRVPAPTIHHVTGRCEHWKYFDARQIGITTDIWRDHPDNLDIPFIVQVARMMPVKFQLDPATRTKDHDQTPGKA